MQQLKNKDMIKKRIFPLALAAAALVSFSSYAQTPSQQQTDCTQKKECVKKDKKNRMAKADPFQGITLTADQQARLQKLESDRREARKKIDAERRDQKQRFDAEKMKARRDARKSYLEEVKSIIGPDNYVMFLENIYVSGPQMKAKAASHPGHDKKRHDAPRGKGRI